MSDRTSLQQVDALNKTLMQAFVDREEGQAKVDAANLQIKAIRNVLAGVKLGEQVQKDLAKTVAEQAALKEKRNATPDPAS